MSPSALTAHAEPVMGTVVSYLVERGDLHPDAVRAAIGASVAEVHRLAGLLSVWDEASPMSRLRRGELSAPEFPGEIREVLRLCAQLRDLSGGWFDPWAMPGGVDPTGLAKGWIIEQAVDRLLECGIESCLVNGGGDIATAGAISSRDGHRATRIGIQHPWRREALACVIEIPPGGAVATSGSYERGGHLLDPFSGRAVGTERPLDLIVSVTVTGASLAVADGLATAIAVTRGDPYAIVEAAGRGYEAYFIFGDGSEQWTPSFPFAAAAESPGGSTEATG